MNKYLRLYLGNHCVDNGNIFPAVSGRNYLRAVILVLWLLLSFHPHFHDFFSESKGHITDVSVVVGHSTYSLYFA